MQPAGVILYKNEVEETRVNSELKSVGAAGARTKKKQETQQTKQIFTVWKRSVTKPLVWNCVS